jgi:hypothetical protein
MIFLMNEDDELVRKNMKMNEEKEHDEFVFLIIILYFNFFLL